MKVHRTVFVVDAPFLDAQNIVEAEDAFEQYLAKIEEPSRLPVDFERIKYISSGFGIINRALNPDFQHQLLCMRLKEPIIEVFKFLGLLEMKRFDLVHDEQCPACKEAFDYDKYNCKSCGTFETEVFKWPRF